MKKYSFIILSLLLASCAGSKKTKSTTSSNEKNLNTGGITYVSETENKAQYTFIKAEGLYIKEEYYKALIEFEKVLALEPKQATTYFKIAQCQVQTDQVEKALVNAKNSVKHNPENETFAFFLADLHKSNNDLSEANAVYQNLINNTNNKKYYQQKANIYNDLARQSELKKTSYIRQGDETAKKKIQELDTQIKNYKKEELSSLQELEDAYGKNPTVITQKLKLYLSFNDFDNALLENHKLISVESHDLNHKFREAEILYNYKSPEEAINYMETVVKENPSSSKSHLILSGLYKKNGSESLFKEHLEKAIALPEMTLQQKITLVSEMLQSNEKETGLSLAKRIKELHPTQPQAHSVLGDAYLTNNQILEARNSYYNVTKYDNSKKIIWNQILDLDSRLEQEDSIENHLSQALAIFPNEMRYYLMLGDLKTRNEEYLSAKNILENGLDQVTNNFELEYEFNLRLGDVFFNLKEYDNCYKSFEKALEYDPNNAYALNNYSYYLAESNGDLDIAKSNGSRLVRLYPGDYNYADTYAWILYKREEYKEAYEFIKKAVKGGNGVVLEHAGDIAYKLNKENEAIDYWKKAKITGGASESIDTKIELKKIP